MVLGLVVLANLEEAFALQIHVPIEVLIHELLRSITLVGLEDARLSTGQGPSRTQWPTDCISKPSGKTCG